jgi:uncharacterized protein with GYD domain
MVRYLSSINFTVQGIRDMKHSVNRAGEFRVDVERCGGKVLFQYWAIGEADGFFAFEVPNESEAVQLLLRLEQQGNVRTKTVRVFNEDEFRSMATTE